MLFSVFFQILNTPPVKEMVKKVMLASPQKCLLKDIERACEGYDDVPVPEHKV